MNIILNKVVLPKVNRIIEKSYSKKYRFKFIRK